MKCKTYIVDTLVIWGTIILTLAWIACLAAMGFAVIHFIVKFW